ncbi:hypothetical protein [Hymenobacter frigidus]|uniref:hypothetical protein n=1 Tax=Hymenobacter frigidus TaxID=1524095 RepID=UPI001665A5E9|nr:hypothetical protein [Hymenobacter frigidus]
MHPVFTLASVRRSANALLYVSSAQLLLFLGTAGYSFWWARNGLVVQVQAHEIANGRPHLSTVINSPVGAYFTGTQGMLLYQPTSFWENLLLYRISGITIVDALFMFAVGLYLWRVLLRLRAGQEFALRPGRVFTVIGGLTAAMYVIKMTFDLGIARLFETRTNHLFYLSPQPSSMVYVFMGSLLLACGQLLRRSEELQQDADLTI